MQSIQDSTTVSNESKEFHDKTVVTDPVKGMKESNDSPDNSIRIDEATVSNESKEYNDKTVVINEKSIDKELNDYLDRRVEQILKNPDSVLQQLYNPDQSSSVQDVQCSEESIKDGSVELFKLRKTMDKLTQVMEQLMLSLSKDEQDYKDEMQVFQQLSDQQNKIVSLQEEFLQVQKEQQNKIVSLQEQILQVQKESCQFHKEALANQQESLEMIKNWKNKK